MIPVLTDWRTLRQVAASLGISKQAVYKMLMSGKYASAHRLGDEGKPIYVISTEEMQQMERSRT